MNKNKLTDEEIDILSDALSSKSEEANGDFFPNIDQFKHLFESKASEVISPDRINSICDEYIAPLYEGGVTPKYEVVQRHMQEYGVLMDEANPSTLNSESPVVDPFNNSAKGQENEEKSKVYDENNGVSSRQKKDSGIEKPENEKKENSSKKDGISDYEGDEESVQQRTRDVRINNEKYAQEAARLRALSPGMLSNPHALMGHTLAKFGIIANRVVSNLLASRIPFMPKALVNRFPILGQTLSGKNFMGLKIGQNTKDVRFERKWMDGTNNDKGSSILKKSDSINNNLLSGDYKTALNEFKDLDDSIKKKDYKLDKESRKKLQETLASFTQFLDVNKDDSKERKEQKKQMKKLTEKINNFIKKLFGGKISHKKGNDGPSM